LWKVVAASALCFLAGYPASFVAFAVGTTVYAVAGSWRRGLMALTAIAAGLAVSGIQLLPAAEASGSKSFDPKYGAGVWDPLFGSAREFVRSGILRGLPRFLKSDVFNVGSSHALYLEE
jgi:hypothetical protein